MHVQHGALSLKNYSCPQRNPAHYGPKGKSLLPLNQTESPNPKSQDSQLLLGTL